MVCSWLNSDNNPVRSFNWSLFSKEKESFKDRWWDTLSYAMLASEWNVAKES